MRRAWPVLRPLWVESTTEIGRLLNMKQEREREWRWGYTRAQAERGRKGGVAKAYKNKETSLASAKQTPEVCSSLPIPSPSPSHPYVDTKKPIRRRDTDYSVDFLMFWDSSSKRGSKLDAWEVWRRIGVTADHIEKINAGMAAWLQSEQWQDENKQPHICRWLKREGWTEIVPKSNGGSNGAYRGDGSQNQGTLIGGTGKIIPRPYTPKQ